MLNTLLKTQKGINKFLEGAVISLVGIMALSIIISVFLRYVFNISFVWMEEAIGFVFLGVTYIGIVLGINNKSHIVIDCLEERVSHKTLMLLKIIRAVLVFLLLVIIVKCSISWIEQVGNVESPGTRIEKKYIYSLMPFSFILCIFYEFIELIKGFKGGEQS